MDLNPISMDNQDSVYLYGCTVMLFRNKRNLNLIAELTLYNHLDNVTLRKENTHTMTVKLNYTWTGPQVHLSDRGASAACCYQWLLPIRDWLGNDTRLSLQREVQQTDQADAGGRPCYPLAEPAHPRSPATWGPGNSRVPAGWGVPAAPHLGPCAGGILCFLHGLWSVLSFVPSWGYLLLLVPPMLPSITSHHAPP